MTDKRTIKFEIAVDADTKGVDRFNKVLRDLENAAPIAESELRKVRQGILEFSQQSGTSATSLKALEAALTKLQSEARGGSALWKTLGGDIAGVRQQYGELTGTIRSAEQAQKDLNRALNAPVGNTFGKIAEQTSKLKNELRDLNYRSQEYIRTLTRVKELETVGSFRQGRLNTIAANQAFMGATLSRGYGAPANLPSLPDTLAGDAQRVSELSERIRNLDRGSELYLQTIKELTAANDQLARSQREYNRELAGTAEIERRRTVEGAAQSRLSLADRAAELRRDRQQFERDAAQRARGEALLLSQADGRSTISSGRDALSLSARAAEQRRRRQEFEREARARAAEDFIATSQASGRRTIESGRDALSLSAAAAEQRRRRQEFEREARARAAEDFIATSQASGRRTIESGRETLSLSGRAAELRRQRQQREQEAAQRAASNAIFERQAEARSRTSQLTYQNQIAEQARVERERAASARGERRVQAAAEETARRQAEARSRTSQASQRLRILGLSTQPNDYFDGINARAAAERERIRQAAERRQAEAEQERVRARSAYMRRLRNAGEISTAIGVAGYFGGPEAVAGAAAGAIFGPGGAQVGTTLGLAAGGLRQQVAGLSDQAAQLNKLQISLKSIAGSEAEYTRAMNAITSANREFNIPLLEGTRAMTQLTAAVKGAGGTVADAEIAYRGITAAIKATGGSSADAEGAIRALVQTFSKGKVSAEEIRQQLAERLPGAVTLFAQATGRTGAELDKAFEKGEVGLNDLMKFLATLNTRYSETARRLAASNDEAGLRLQLRWEQTTLAIGKAFAPLGAEIQNSLLKILTDNEGNIKQWADTTVQNIKRVAKAFNDVSFEAKRFSGFLDSIPREIKVLVRMLPLGFNAPIFQYLGAQGVLDANKQFNPDSYISGLGGKAQDASVFKKQLKQVESNIAKASGEIANYGPAILPSDRKKLDALRSTVIVEYIKQGLLNQAIGDAGKGGKASPKPSNFQNPTAQAASDAEANKQRRIAEQLAAERQRLLETTAQQEIRLADEVYRHQIELDDQRYERRRRRLDDEARAEIARLSPNRRDVASLALAIQQGNNDDASQRRQLQQAVEQAQRQVTNAQRMAAVTGTSLGTSSGDGIIARTGNTGIGTGAHLDARWADGRPISAADVDRYLRVNGRAPSSYGVTSGYGPRTAPTRGASSFHRGIDFGTPAGSGISVANGAQLLRDLGFTGAGGYAVEIDTPQGRMRLLHLQGGSATGRTPTGVAAQQRRNVVDNADVLSAQQGLTSAKANLAAFDQEQAAGAQARTNRLIAEYAQQTRDSTAALLENTQQLRDRTRYTLEGYRPEDIDFLVQRNAEERKYSDIINQARTELDAQRMSLEAYNKLIEDQTNAHLQNVDALQQQAKAQREARLAAEGSFDIRAGARQYVESIGTMRDASATLTQTGIKGVEDALFSLATTGTANFQAFAASILQDTARMIIQQLVLKTIMSSLGFLKVAPAAATTSPTAPGGDVWGAVGRLLGNANGNAFTEQGIQLFATGGIVSKPTLFGFANGAAMSAGVMGEAGPEAIMPLKRGPDGKLGVAASGGSGVQVGSINITVQNTGPQLDVEAQKQIANQVRVITLSTLANEKRSGGMIR